MSERRASVEQEAFGALPALGHMLSFRAMGDEQGRLKLNPSAAPGADIVASSSPPSTEDIDAEWGSSPDAALPPREAAGLAPFTPAASELASPSFPSDPPLPAELELEAHLRAANGASSGGVARSRTELSMQQDSAPNWQPEPQRKHRNKVFVAVGFCAALAAVWLVRGGSGASHSEVSATVPEPAAPTAAATPANESAVRAPSSQNAGSAAPSAVAQSPALANAPAASAAAESTAKTSTVIRVEPASGRIFYRGKDAGRPPLTVELEPGKRRAFEVGAPGYQTRKVVVDGSKSEISVTLRPVPSSP